MSGPPDKRWRASSFLMRALAIMNHIPIGERSLKVGGRRLYADSVDRLIALLQWKLGIEERDERALIERVVQPGMVAVDVGANVGLHTLGLAARVGASGRVHALEPEPANLRLLARAVKKAHVTNVRLHQVAASDRPGTITLYVSAANRGDHRTAPASEARREFVVSCVRLDDLLASEEHVDFVKIDVQGAEVAVFRGLEKTLARNPGVSVLAELCPDLIRRAGSTTEDFFGALRAAGLVPHRVLADGAVEPVTERVATDEAERSGYLNLYFARGAAAGS